VSERFTTLWDKAVAVKQIRSLQERAEVYSLLWNRNEQFTKLFIKLTASLQELGNEPEIHLPISSLTPRSTSIIDVSILEHLDGQKSDVEVIKTSVKEVSIEKSVLSALISELYLPIVNPKRTVFEKADLLDFLELGLASKNVCRTTMKMVSMSFSCVERLIISFINSLWISDSML
jgi:hypothetical protein